MFKRLFDIVISLISILIVGCLLILFWIIASIDTKSNGLFLQQRIGQFGERFTIYKLKTVRPKTHTISRLAQFLRKSKIDELPQLWNVLKGDMSFVGPRPDIQGYYDKLQGEARKILELKPGLTSLASIKYANEELLLASQENSLHYNDTVIFPDKVRMNLYYYYHHSLLGDMKIILKTIFR